MFEQLAIDPQVADAINNAVQHNRLPHALLLEGSDEATRHAAAKQIAAALVCNGAGPKPCGSCAKCKKANAGSHPDLYLIEPEKEGAFIKVDAIRTLKAHALLRPNDGEKSVFHIREAQMMNVQAQNALLKILEEPDAHVCIILTCPSKAALLETILSRVTAYALSNETALDAPNEAAAETAAQLLQTWCDCDELALLVALAPLQKDRARFCAALNCCRLILRDALVGANEEAALGGEGALAVQLRRRFTQKQLLALMDAAQESAQALDRNANFNLILTLFCCRCGEIKYA